MSVTILFVDDEPDLEALVQQKFRRQIRDGAVKTHGRSGDLDRLLAQRGIRPLGMPAWHRIDAAELKLGASHGRLRTTLAHRRELLEAAEKEA